MKPYTPYLKILTGLKYKIQADILKKHGIQCETADWMDCAVLKLQKKSWTQNGMGEGIFFSVWIGEKELKKDRLNYNIHALKLREWKDHDVKPVQFAASFRRQLRPSQKQWPNLKLDYGPHTLMQGWIDLDLETMESDVLKLIREFVGIHGIFDEMIAAKKK